MTPLSPTLHGTVEGKQRNVEQANPVKAARRLILSGGVQGLGVRPAIFRLATKLGIRGSVCNSSRGVEIEIEGTEPIA